MRSLLLAASALSLAYAAPALADAPAADPASTAAAALAPVPPGKLTDAARPLAYRLDLSVDPAQERFSGHVEIDATLKAPSQFIDLHGRDLKMARVTASAGGKVLTGRWFELDPSGVARLVFDEPLPAGKVTFSFDYDAPFQQGPSGMFRVKVGEDWYSWTQFQSIDARAAFPGFDEPGFKVPFTVTLRTRKGHTAVSNAPEVSTSTEGDWQVHRFAPTLPLPTYLMAMMVGPFATLEGKVAPTPQRKTPLPIRIVTTKQNADRMSFALEGTKGIVTHLERYFNQGFPYPKLDQITTPILPGAMENAGADLYADPILILDEKAPTSQKRSFGMVVAHELSHQWFGDLVTPAWWDDIWLNESFANWMGFRIGHEWRPNLNIRAGALAEGFSAMNTDSLVAGRAIHQPIQTNAQIDEAFDSITYGKGGHVVAMIAGYMGDTKFRDGVRRYMAKHRYGNATSTDFFAAMAEASGDPRIVPAMQSFTDQQGVPLVTFAADGKGGYRISQSRYVRLGTTAPAVRWGVPVCVRKTGGARQCQMLTGESAGLQLRGKGVLVPNLGGTGYYRFELPARDWDALIALADRLPGGEALALDDSLYASFLAGRASPAQLVASARNLARNKDSYASEAGMGSIGALARTGMLDQAGEAGFRRLVEQIYRPRLAAMGFDPKAGAYAGEDPERSQQREQVVGELVGSAKDPALRKQLASAAQAYFAGDANALDPAWFGMAFAVLVDEGGLPAAKTLTNKALASQDPVFRPYALGVVAGSGNAEIARWVLNDFADPRLRKSERLDMVRTVISTRETRDLGFEWLKANFDQLTNGGGGIFSAARLPAVLSGFCSVERSDEIAALLRPKLKGRTGALELERTVERVRSCGVLKDKRGAEFSAELAKVK
ncbi:M1 family metallopeptidase [Novosphingobium sp.]|uniref:M1 family metallopeptidase n=1 Tax=Novosphingobium sp. TaxID=1874826 RepID=UPI0025D7B91B|nr:M1 family metallopeptidase [Novosphingobium sp.]MCC6924462.1 M1 family metallopeptidase [Novosphingobium sp.]